MTRIEVCYVDNKVNQLTITGHSNFAQNGQDIVCAGISAIVYGGCNAIKQPSEFLIKDPEGSFEIKVIGSPDEYDYQTLEVMVTQLKTICESYPKYVKIVEKGK